MGKIKVQVDAVRCERCGYTYIPEVPDPVKCPKCQHRLGSPVRKPVSPALSVVENARMQALPYR